MASQTPTRTRLETQTRLETPTRTRLETPTRTRLETPTRTRLETRNQTRLETPTRTRLDTRTRLETPTRLEAWMKASLQRSASLGLEVLARASRRTSVDWTSSTVSQTPPTPEDSHLPVKRKHSELHDVFGTIAGFMAQTTQQCKRFYESGCPHPSPAERNHVSRFHSRPDGRTPEQSAGKQSAGKQSAGEQTHNQAVWTSGEDVSIQVSPGTYVVTASRPESQQQQLIRVRAGESIDLTFDL